ncbi:MAG: UrcA family protein [Proteobacteria bacterium]|nr:UrcA family protein [Pseudomonadota bacterium]
MTRTKLSLSTAAALLLAATFTCAAQAEPALHEGYSHDPSKIVTYTRIDSADLDARTAAGARSLLQRIEVAADAVCGGEANAVNASQKRDYRNCRDDAIRGAVSRMGSPALTTLASRRRVEQVAAR